MLVKRKWLIGSTFLMMIILCMCLDNTIVAGLITFVVVMVVYITIAITGGMKRLNLLEKDCDPDAFLEATLKQKQLAIKNPKYTSYLEIDEVVAIVEKGDIQKGKDILLNVNKKYIEARNAISLIYTIDLVSCLYELGELEKAEEMFETKISLIKPMNKRVALAMESLRADRLYFLGKYDESKNEFIEILNKEELNKEKHRRHKLSIIYRLAQIDEKAGDITSAKKKYKEVMDNGNKLWIAKQSEDKLMELD